MFRIFTPAPAKVQIVLYHVSGKKIGIIADRMLQQGYHQLSYSARLAAGLYVYEVRTGKEIVRKTMIVE